MSDVEAPDADAAEITDLAAFGESFTRDPYPVYAQLRERGPVHRVRLPEGTEAWLVVGHEAARATLADSRLTKSWDHAAPEVGPSPFFVGHHMLNTDPPGHARLRGLVAREFTPRRVAGLAPRVEELTNELLDTMLASPGGAADLVESFSLPLPLGVICELIGVPFLDRDAFHGWTLALVGVAPKEEKDAARAAVGEYLQSLVEHRRRKPGDDLLSGLVHGGPVSAEDADGSAPLSDDELVAMLWLLLVAGHETTVNLISNAVLGLLTHPAQLAALKADFSLTDNLVEEALRYDGPVETSTYRFTREAVEIAGTVIPGGGQLVLPVIADGDRDPAKFPEPDRFDIRRRTRGHLAFGHGIHFCLGAPLARLEGRTALRTLFERAPRLRLDAHPAALTWRQGMVIRGPHRLPVRFG
ncbi:cytochrome P450 [Streptomyces sp. HNM0574]|uniref:cytochrome P450 family protein n=1 Tax=Streptomyces sp. HNM0574 TaxID=2714954 RepID=UPI00146B6975|nr:cytochrome P450 [Streptomyces sp. HNM0574]NLU65972.1 cytochrome P450 [Streptomyces sp. HNM0574]